MDVVDLLAELGGTATRSRLGGRVTGDELSRACEAGLVVRVERGRYALPGVAAAPRAALACGGVLCGRSAALQHGWGVAVVPDRPEVTVPQNRRVATTARRGVALHRAWLAPDDVVEVAGVPTTTPERTLADCLRRLPLGEALAVADSALRDGFDAVRLSGMARALRGPGSVQARRTAAAATPLAAGPFESALRAIALDVPLLDVQPQVELWSGWRLPRPTRPRRPRPRDRRRGRLVRLARPPGRPRPRRPPLRRAGGGGVAGAAVRLRAGARRRRLGAVHPVARRAPA